MASSRGRRLCTRMLVCFHVHSLILFVALLCVASKDLNSTKAPKTTPSPSPTSTTPRPTSTAKPTTKQQNATTTTAPSTTRPTSTTTEATVIAFHVDSDSNRWRDFDILRANQNDLREYKLFLESTLANVSRMLDGEDRKSKRFVAPAVPSVTPDQNTTVLSNTQDESPEVEKVEEETTPFASTTEEPPTTTTEPPTSSTTEATTQQTTEESEATTPLQDEPKDKEEQETKPPKPTPDEAHPPAQPRAFGVQTTHLDDGHRAAPFEPTQNHTVEECKKLTQAELVSELKQKGTYNPDLMAWDVSGVFRFLDRSIVDQYERQVKSQKSNKQAVQRNVEALERILTELNLRCDVRAPDVLSRLGNLTLAEPRRTVMSPSLRMTDAEVRFKRHVLTDDLLRSFGNSRRSDDVAGAPKRQKMIGDVHVVPFGCDKRGGEEDGYLRLCGACQAIRKLPETFFPPFINEVMCDEDKACLYFYDYPHGKCKQKHMNFVVLRNVGTQQCQVWQKFNLNVRVSCECFVDEMSFFSKYV